MNARIGFWIFMLAFAAAVTWPGATLFNRVEPYIFGMPFNLIWIAAWVAASGVALYLLDRSESARAAGSRDVEGRR